MKKLLLLGVAGILAFSTAAFSQTTTLWQQTAANNNLPSWFATNNTQRNFAYANVGGKGHLYIMKAGGLSPILILDASTGDSIGTLDETGISGGTFLLDDIESSTNGAIFAANLTVNAKSSPFKVYEWTSDSAKPKMVISYSDSSYRLGDHFTVVGSSLDNSLQIWVAATKGSDVVKFTTADSGATFTPTVISLSSPLGSVPKVAPLPNGDFFVSSGGKGIQEFDATGKLLGSVASMPSTLGSMAYISGGSPMKAYVFGYDYTNAAGTPPQYVQINDVTSGITAADSVGVTPVMGTTLDANGTGDIALNDNGDGTVTIYVLSTNNGIGAYKFTAWTTSSTPTRQTMPVLWQQTAAKNNLPSWFATNNTQRNFAYANVGGKGHLYIMKAGGLSPILILDASTGDSIGTLDETGITGGTFLLDDIESSTNGAIFAGNLTVNAKSSPFKVYEWTSDSAKPKMVISYSDSSYRLGDHFTVTGSSSDNSLQIWVAATNGSDVVRFTTKDSGATFTPTVIPLSSPLGSVPKVAPLANGDFFVSSGGKGVEEFDSTGKFLGSVASMPSTLGSMAYISGGSPMKAYVFGYDYTNAAGTPPQYVQVADITNGITKADSVSATPILGTTLDANGTGDIALNDNGDGTVTVYVLSTNNGIGAYKFTAWQPAPPPPPPTRNTMPVLWQATMAKNNLPSWFATNNTQRNCAYADVAGKGHLYVTKAGGLSPILILDASTGDSIGTLDETGITGGTFVLDDIESSTDGLIFACNLTINAKSSPFKVYEWSSETAKPKMVISYSDSSYRLGDHFTVTGSSQDNSLAVWVAATNGSDVVKFTTTDNGATFTPTVIKLDSVLGPVPKVAPLANGDFFVSSAGKGIEEFSSTGKFLGSVTSMPSSLGSMAYISGGAPMKAYVFGYDYTNTSGTPPQYVQVADITNGITKADSVSATPILGTNLDANGTGDIALKQNSDGSVTVFVLSTNNGIGAYTFNAQLTAVNQEKNPVPTTYELSQNYPNPFNPTTQITYSIPKSSFVTLKVYNVLGQEVATLFSGERNAGTYTATFNASRFASGVYFYRLTAGSFSSVKKMVLVK